MNVPHASHMGGSWERQIRSARGVLSGLLDVHGDQLDDESLRTFMVEAEAIINSLPLSLSYAGQLGPLLTMKSNVVLPYQVNFSVRTCIQGRDGVEFSI